MEKLVRDQLLEHLESNNLLTPHQHGFRKGRSCTTQLLEVTNDWSTALDAKDIVDCIYLDYRKAFDSVPHTRLLAKDMEFKEKYGLGLKRFFLIVSKA